MNYLLDTHTFLWAIFESGRLSNSAKEVLLNPENSIYVSLITFWEISLMANIITWPIAYYIMKKWLQNFAYHTTIRIDTFIISGLLAFLIALLTVSYQSIKAARANPVDALKYE